MLTIFPEGMHMDLFQKLLGVKDHEGNRLETPQLKDLYKKTISIAFNYAHSA